MARPSSSRGKNRPGIAPLFNPAVLAAALGLAPASGALAQQGDAVQLPAVTVNATAVDDSLVHLDRPVNGGALGSRTQLETPFSTTVVTAADMEARQVAKLGDVFALDASVSDNSSANGAWASYLTVRGLPLDWQNSYRIDGKPFLSYVTTLPYEHFEQIDLLKGASGFMYGFGTPGGLVNYVTKKPTDEPVRAIDLGYGSKGLLREHVDLGGRAGASGAFGYRLNATHEEGTTYNDGSLYRDSVSLALDARLSERLTWDFQSIYQDRKAVGIEPTITTSSMTGGKLPGTVRNSDTLVGEGPYANNHFRFYATGLKYQLNDAWTFSTNYSYSSTRTRRNESVLTLRNGAGDYDDYRSDYGEAYQYNQWQGMAEGKFNTGSLRHHVVLGASWQKQKNDYSSNGVYQLMGTGNLRSQNTNTYYSDGSLHLYRAAEITQKALFASDTVDLTDRWSVLGGVRYTNYEQTGFDTTGARTSRYEKNGVPTPTVALMFKITPQTMAYASYMESLEPGSVVGTQYANYGALLDPLKSKQYELGVKTEQDDWAASAALFRIEKKAEYSNADRVLVQDGKSIYQGLELAGSARIATNWNVGGSLMLLDSEYRQGVGFTGNRVAGAPKFVAAAQVAYSVPQLPGLKLRADVKYTGKTMLDPGNVIDVPGYAIVNIGATYDTRIYGYETTFRAGVNNLADKRYWLYQSPNYVKVGDPRTYGLSASLKF
ncbi:Ferric-anguibactin receptor FatA [Achromobacter insuavis]|uniref:TonB-dependent siderophore receptor n=1 Tax=Achromobacter insuavis TaxID=1287735 RepID=UPI0014655FEB|nr:TonB-dependent receptor [Achromobacter insuavis]CAB3842315.1 Ferric-anguibactin receptor FatA [Achromobacter insuavis]